MNTVWHTLSGIMNDQFWSSVVLLLHGDGTNTAQNNTFLDSSNTPKTITRNGNTTQGSFSPFTGQGGSMYFDGNGDYLSLTGTSLAGTDFTIEGWVNFASFAQTSEHIFNFGSDSYNRFALYRDPGTGKFAFGTVNSGAYNITVSTSDVIQVGQWYHVAFVRSASNTTIYVNGQSKGTNSGSIVSGTNWGIGFQHFGSSANDYFNGYLSNLRITKGQALYTANFTPPTAPLTSDANTSLLLKGENGGIIDSTRKNDLETVGNAQISTAQRQFGGSSMYFDGSGDYLLSSYNADYNMGVGDFTIDVWVYPTSSAVSETSIVNRSARSGLQVTSYEIKFDGSHFGYHQGTGSGLIQQFMGYETTARTINQWYHLALVKTSTSSKLYVNGQLVLSSATVYSDVNVSDSLYVGGRATSDFYFQGYIDDLRITKGVARYTGNFTPPTQPFPNF